MQLTITTPADAHTARLDLVRLRAEQRVAKRSMDYIEAQITVVVDGKNAEQRAAQVVIRCNHDPEYCDARDTHDDAAAQIGAIEAALLHYVEERDDARAYLRESELEQRIKEAQQ